MDQTPWGEGVSGVQRLPEYTAFGDELFQFFMPLTNFFVFLQIKSVQFLQIPKLTLRFREGETLLPWTKRLEREGKLLRIERGGVGTRGDESGCKPERRSRCVDASVSHLLVRWNPDFVAGETYPSAIWGFFFFFFLLAKSDESYFSREALIDYYLFSYRVGLKPNGAGQFPVWRMYSSVGLFMV